MSDYSKYETILAIALPQIHSNLSGEEWTRTIQITKDADQDFVVSKDKVKIAPALVTADDFNIATFCLRISREVTEFETRAEREADLIREEFKQKLENCVDNIIKRWGIAGLDEMLSEVMPAPLRIEQGEPAALNDLGRYV